MFETGALHVLKDEHRAICRALEELLQAGSPAEQERSRREVAVGLRLYTSIEEEDLFPDLDAAFHEDSDRLVLRRIQEEHRLIDVALEELLAARPGSNEFTATAQMLQELVRMHVDEEEQTLFPRAKRLLDRDRRAELGDAMRARKDTLRIEIEQDILAQTS